MIDPRRLTDDQLMVILALASSLSRIKSQIEFLKNKDRAEDIMEVSRQLWIVVTDTGKKPQRAMEHNNPQWAGDEAARLSSK